MVTQGVTRYHLPRGGKQEDGEILSVSRLVTSGGLRLPFFPGSGEVSVSGTWGRGSRLPRKGGADLICVAFLEASLTPFLLLCGASPRGRPGL